MPLNSSQKWFKRQIYVYFTIKIVNCHSLFLRCLIFSTIYFILVCTHANALHLFLQNVLKYPNFHIILILKNSFLCYWSHSFSLLLDQPSLCTGFPFNLYWSHFLWKSFAGIFLDLSQGFCPYYKFLLDPISYCSVYHNGFSNIAYMQVTPKYLCLPLELQNNILLPVR